MHSTQYSVICNRCSYTEAFIPVLPSTVGNADILDYVAWYTFSIDFGHFKATQMFPNKSDIITSNCIHLQRWLCSYFNSFQVAILFLHLTYGHLILSIRDTFYKIYPWDFIYYLIYFEIQLRRPHLVFKDTFFIVKNIVNYNIGLFIMLEQVQIWLNNSLVLNHWLGPSCLYL